MSIVGNVTITFFKDNSDDEIEVVLDGDEFGEEDGVSGCEIWKSFQDGYELEIKVYDDGLGEPKLLEVPDEFSEYKYDLDWNLELQD